MNKLEQNFKELLDYLKKIGYQDMRQMLKNLKQEEIPKKFKESFKFWSCLTGPSKDFMIDVVEGRRANKKFAKDDTKTMREAIREKRIDYPFPEMK